MQNPDNLRCIVNGHEYQYLGTHTQFDVTNWKSDKAYNIVAVVKDDDGVVHRFPTDQVEGFVNE